MADAWKSMNVAEFESVRVSPSVALLRVSGKPARRHGRSGPRPVLVADDGHGLSRFVAIPAPVDERGVLRAAYSVPSELIEPTTTFSLELSGGGLLTLPSPSSGAVRILPEPDAKPASEVDDDVERAPGGDERRWALASKLTELSARVADAEADAHRAATALAELETWRGELERRLTETTDELSAATAARAQDEAELSRLDAELAESEAKVDLLQAEVKALHAQLQQAGEPAAPVDHAEPVFEHAEAPAEAASPQGADGTEARIEEIRDAAEAQARELAERELAQAQATSADE